MPNTSYDALIIGSGQAGNPLATTLADAGQRVVLVEENLLGGSCINYGCTPTKAMLASAERAHQLRTAGDYGLQPVKPAVDMAAVVARKNHIVQAMREGVRSNLTQERQGITVLHGQATFVGPRTVRVALAGGETQRLTAKKVFINTGTRAAIPDIEGLQDVPFLTTTQLLDLPEVPEHLLILGGGYIGLEFSQMYRRFGSRVTIIEAGRQLLEREDDDACQALTEVLEAEGVEIVLGAEVRRVSRSEAGVFTLTAHTATGERRLRGTHLLVATGRVPNTDTLGLDQAGVQLDEKGYIQVNARLETTVRGVYALGDVHGGPQFTHISYDDYRVVRANLLHRGPRRSARQRPLPYCVFTEPQLGRIGLNEQQAREQGIAYRVATLPVSTIGRARQTGRTTGFWKVLVGEDDRLLGATVLCAEGGEIMSMFQLIMAGRLKYEQLQNMVLAHPTWAEGLNNVFRELQKPELKA
ncbi:mercuric reductase [Hymenobacter psychrotolerans]|uniref:Pyruvate/2-oxoglutarate dehydrogenase complex, dihydrolipoamide dehydrogenase (E3) component n=1 Tax=Hymenobacter psychrotolerans DSM 18569 TaxID=1121959 RepID=A0A1M7DT85_9BACT|nr:mercuric reductase [Hymenobacter psychrotolerans]SHL82578.1 Pyruvate/2-oxoglutarate dehydrogenase complex, dihydrolipoamide dehydrogenase (E3) component [Hymenobacter psychrotolerans DSM 18569]